MAYVQLGLEFAQGLQAGLVQPLRLPHDDTAHSLASVECLFDVDKCRFDIFESGMQVHEFVLAELKLGHEVPQHPVVPIGQVRDEFIAFPFDFDH